MPNVWYNYYENVSPSSVGDGNKDFDLVYRLRYHTNSESQGSFILFYLYLVLVCRGRLHWRPAPRDRHSGFHGKPSQDLH